MSAKALLPSQCDFLHMYWPNDCCLCKANAHIKELESQIGEYQLCPKCNGERYIPHPEGGHPQYCIICDGKGIIARPHIACQHDDESLAQPSPLTIFPSVASDGTGDDLRFPNICTGDIPWQISAYTEDGKDVTQHIW